MQSSPVLLFYQYVAKNKSGTPLVTTMDSSQINIASGIGQSARLFGQSSGMMTAAKMMTMFIVASVASGHVIVSIARTPSTIIYCLAFSRPALGKACQ